MHQHPNIGVCEEVLQPRNEGNIAELAARFVFGSFSKPSLITEGTLIEICVVASICNTHIWATVKIQGLKTR